MKPLIFVAAASSMAMMAFVALIGPIARSVGLAAWQAGATVTVAGLLWMLLARPWGTASDRHGRRVVLLICTSGFFISYLLLCAAVYAGLSMLASTTLTFIALMIARGAIGAFYAGVSTTSLALVADHLPPEKRASAMASIGAASAAGLIAGPALAGALAPVNLSLPLYAAAILPLLAVLILGVSLPRAESHAALARSEMQLQDARIRRPMAVAFVAMFSVAVAQITVGFYALDRLKLGSNEAASAAGFALTAVGVAVLLSQLAVRKLAWSPTRLIRVGCLIASVGFASVILATSAPLLWTSYFVAAAGMGLVFPSFSALAANSVEPTQQGAAAGSVGAAQGLGMVIGPLAGTVVYGIAPFAPYIVVAVVLLACALWPEERIARDVIFRTDDRSS
ncbi:MFS transporter [Erythrobacter sp. QSSC1-22B]|nr:MFS transporter [Erythrobacter sp. QSSC1-22B]